jgi:hypothetical protein
MMRSQLRYNVLSFAFIASIKEQKQPRSSKEQGEEKKNRLSLAKGCTVTIKSKEL